MRKHRPFSFWRFSAPDGVTLVYLALFRREPIFSAVLQAFLLLTFFEKWQYLPIALGSFCRGRNFLPGGKSRAAIFAGMHLPSVGKIDA